MMKDPLTQWTGGAFPYDVLSEAGIGPESSISDVNSAAFDLIEGGSWSVQKRFAWDELRTVDNRLWVDFLMFPASEEIVADIPEATSEPEPASLDFSTFGPDSYELRRMERDFYSVDPTPFRADCLPQFDDSIESILSEIEFDC